MRALTRRLSKLEARHSAQRTVFGQSPVDVLRHRRCRRLAQETGKPYEELLREDQVRAEAFWKRYDGDGSLADILRFRYKAAVAQKRSAPEIQA